MSIQNNASILRLPQEVVFPGIEQYTNSRDLTNLSNTCTLMKTMQKNNIDLWKRRVESTPTLKLPKDLIFYGIGPCADAKSRVNLFNTCKSMHWISRRKNRYDIRKADLCEKNPLLRKIMDAFFRGEKAAMRVFAANCYRQNISFLPCVRQDTTFRILRNLVNTIMLIPVVELNLPRNLGAFCVALTMISSPMISINIFTNAHYHVGFSCEVPAITDCIWNDWSGALLMSAMRNICDDDNFGNFRYLLSQPYSIAKASFVALTQLIKNPSKTALQLAAGAKFVAEERPNFAFFSIAMIFAMFALFDTDSICAALGAMALYDIGSNLF